MLGQVIDDDQEETKMQPRMNLGRLGAVRILP